MKKLLIYPDVLHLGDVGHLKFGKILSLAVILMVLFAGSGQQAKSEELDTAKIIWTTTLQNQSEVWSAKFFHNGDSIIVVEKNSVFIVDAKTGKICSTLSGLIPYRRINLSPDEKYIYGSQKYNLHTRQVENTINPSYKLREIFLSPLGDKLYATTHHSSGTVPYREQDSNLIIIDANSYQVTKWLSISAQMDNLRTTQDGKYLITDEYDTGCCWDLMQPAAIFSITRLRYANTLEPASEVLNNGIIYVWGEDIHVDAPYTSMGNPIFSNDGKWMITHGNDSVGVWSTDTWELVGTYYYYYIQFGKLLMSCNSKYMLLSYYQKGNQEKKENGLEIYTLSPFWTKVSKIIPDYRYPDGSTPGMQPLAIDCTNNKLLILRGIYEEGYYFALSLIDLPEFVTSVGTDEPKDPDFILYPNPTSNEITINFNEPITEPTTIEISDETGRIIYTNTLEIGISEFNWNTKDLSNGMYLCVVRNNKSSKTYKIMVQR